MSSGRECSKEISGSVDLVEGKQGSGSELPLFTFKCVATATDNFSDENKLGQGGFGPVYKVKLCAKQLVFFKNGQSECTKIIVLCSREFYLGEKK